MLLNLALFLHIISAIFWIGGMLFLTLVVVPFLQGMPDPKERSRVYQTVGTKYRTFGWVAIITLITTGPFILYSLYGVAPGSIYSADFHSTGLGKAVAAKVTLVIIIVLTSLVHDFWLGPKARNSPGFTFWARVFGRSNLLIALLIVVFAVLIRSGGF